MQERLARRMCAIHPLRAQPLPFPFPAMREMMQYHATRQTDEGLNWLKALLLREAERS